jgi:hypothetical protein
LTIIPGVSFALSAPHHQLAWDEEEALTCLQAKDTNGEWLFATVKECKDTKVFVHYNGWGVQHDEWIPKNSDRLKPDNMSIIRSLRVKDGIYERYIREEAKAVLDLSRTGITDLECQGIGRGLQVRTVA